MEVNNECSQVHRRKERKRERAPKEKPNCSRRQNFLAASYILPTVAAVVCYLNSLEGDFVHDDKYAIQRNPDVTGKSPITELFRNDFWGRPMWDNSSHKSYRPLCILTFRFEYYMGGGDPWFFHVVNVALHALVTCLFVHVQRRVLHVTDLVAGASGLIFAVHPVHTEAVTGIVGRADILSALGILLSLLFYARHLGRDSGYEDFKSAASRGRWIWFWGAIATSGAAMLCKEHGITGLGVCVLLDFFLFSKSTTQRWLATRRTEADCKSLFRRVSIVICAATVFLVFRLCMLWGQMPQFQEEDNPASFSDSFLTRVMTFNYLLVVNTWLLLCPRVLSYDWQVGSVPLVESLSDVRNVATLAFYVICARIAWTCLRGISRQDDVHVPHGDHNNNRKERIDTSDVLSVSMVMMALPFLPSSNLFLRVGFVVAERILYVPSLGFALLVGYGAVVLWHRHKRNFGRAVLVTFFLGFIFLMASKTWTRNHVWMTRENLFRSGLQTFPHNAKMHYNYANFLKDAGFHKEAAEHYKIAIRLYPTHPSYHNNLGNVLTDVDAAEACFREALRLMPSHRGALVNLGNLLLERNDTRGEDLLRRVLNLDPNYVDALLSLGQLALRREDWGEAETYLKAALAQRPNKPDIHNIFGVLYHNTGQYERALASYKRAVMLDKGYTPALTNAATSLRELGRHSEAEDLLKRVVAADWNTEAMEKLGQLYQHVGRTRDAISIYTQMAQRAPNDTHVLLSYVKVLLEDGDVEQAASVLAGVLARAPHHLEALFAMSHVQMLRGNSQEALSVLKEAAQWSGEDPAILAKIYFDQGNIYKDLKEYALALQCYQSSVEADSAMMQSHHNLGALYHLMGHYDKARRHYEHVLRVEPDNDTVRKNLYKLERAQVSHREQRTKH